MCLVNRLFVTLALSQTQENVSEQGYKSLQKISFSEPQTGIESATFSSSVAITKLQVAFNTYHVIVQCISYQALHRQSDGLSTGLDLDELILCFQLISCSRDNSISKTD